MANKLTFMSRHSRIADDGDVAGVGRHSEAILVKMKLNGFQMFAAVGERSLEERQDEAIAGLPEGGMQVLLDLPGGQSDGGNW